MSDLQVVLGFDMETDIGSWTPFYEGLLHGTPRILDVLKRNDVPATFYFTGDSLMKHAEVGHAVRDAGYEIGAHTLFHETIGDSLYEIPGMLPVLPEEVPNRLRLCTELIEERTGVRPVSFRCPRLFGSTAVVNALDELGYVSDATYPMFYFREQLTPYRPSKNDWTKPGDLRIVELPNFANLALKSKDKYGRDMDQWPLFRTEGAKAMLRHTDSFAEYAKARGVTPFLCFYFHPWEFYQMPQGDIRSSEGVVRPDPFITKNCGEYAVEQLDILIQALKDRGAEFLEAQGAAARWWRIRIVP
ncbi:MAG: polysaccharide deacetylase family protein [Candidatus Hydrogenedentes bacterium]|nr:polysaccharide deacetylase family protein [Candidatus Hydrogenedentota bacterium]